MMKWLAALLIAFPAFQAAAEVRVTDDIGNEIVLPAPAQRIVSLAPHATELLFEAGAGTRVVGTVQFSDHPAAAREIPRVGDSANVDLERVVALRPDLLVVWWQGNSQKHLEKLRSLGIPTFNSRPRMLADIPDAIERLGKLAGTSQTAHDAAQAYAVRLDALQRRYAARPPVPLFFEVWDRPLMTINRDQIISDVIRVCGGRNVFGDERLLVPTVDLEAVVAAKPEAIVKIAEPGSGDDFGLWKKIPGFDPVARGNLLLLRSDTLVRPSPRILEGASELCEALEAVRARRRAGRGG